MEKSIIKKEIWDIFTSNDVKLLVKKYTQTLETDRAKLNYLSWAHAVAIAKSKFPDLEWNYEKFEQDGTVQKLPYFGDENIGYFVETNVTINDITLSMMLPILNNANKSIKKYKYKYFVRQSKEKTVNALTSFDVNTSIMRCFVKNIAMFGLGIELYAGDDLLYLTNANETSIVEIAKADFLNCQTKKDIEQIADNYKEKLSSSVLTNLANAKLLELQKIEQQKDFEQEYIEGCNEAISTEMVDNLYRNFKNKLDSAFLQRHGKKAKERIKIENEKLNKEKIIKK